MVCTGSVTSLEQQHQGRSVSLSGMYGTKVYTCSDIVITLYKISNF